MRRSHAPGLDTKRIRVFRNGQFVWIELPHASDLLLANLATFRFQAVDDYEHGCRVIAEPFPLVLPNRDIFGIEHWCCFAGLQSVATRVLQSAGYDLDTAKLATRHLRVPSIVDHGRCEAIDDEWLRCVRRNDRALVRYKRGTVRPEWMIAQVAHAWPDQSIMVWTKSLTEAKEFTTKLRRLGVTAFWDNGHFEPIGRPQVLVATVDYFSRDTAVQTRDIAFVLDATQISRPAAIEAVRYAYRARMYGFIADDVQPEPCTSDLITAVFGFEQLHIREHGQVVETPDVAMMPYRGGVGVAADESAFTVVQREICRNKGRNHFVAGLCRAVRAGDASGVRLPDEAIHRISGLSNPKIAIMAANLEHALALGRMLPAATLLTGDDVVLHGVSRRDGRRLYRTIDLDDRLCIVTPAARDQIEGTDVVIRADGSAVRR
ncbi:MAG TPA: hypothetical protein VMM76_01590 [Pirellulaceae bacterium]|nr:hypothetical protein [Pirellulaceae bacterium]